MDYSKGNLKVLDKRRGRRVAAIISSVLDKKLSYFQNQKLKVLDIGCSSGIISEYIANHISRRIGIDPEYIGTEIDKSALTLAEKIEKKNMRFVYMEATNLDFSDNTFDIVILSQVYIYFKNKKKLFDEIYRVLAPGGIVYLSGSNKYRIFKPNEPVPVYYSSFNQLKKLCSKFEIEYQTKNVVEHKLGMKLPVPVMVWNLLEPLSSNFVWILVKH